MESNVVPVRGAASSAVLGRAGPKIPPIVFDDVKPLRAGHRLGGGEGFSEGIGENVG